MDILHAMKDALMQYETIDAGQIDDLMERKEVRPPADGGGFDDSSSSEPPKAKEEQVDDSAVEDGQDDTKVEPNLSSSKDIKE